MGSKYQTANYSNTGEKSIIAVDPSSTVTVVVNAGGSDVYDVDVVVQNTNSALRTAAISSQSGNLLKEFTSPIAGIGLNIATNTSADITIEVRESKRAV